MRSREYMIRGAVDEGFDSTAGRVHTGGDLRRRYGLVLQGVLTRRGDRVPAAIAVAGPAAKLAGPKTQLEAKVTSVSRNSLILDAKARW